VPFGTLVVSLWTCFGAFISCRIIIIIKVITCMFY